ncbi:MAG TPA: hypothetical protein VI776_13190 [Anaerolineales bacterium]|nr:hypothetical protein [Anaerolineales bacterium]
MEPVYNLAWRPDGRQLATLHWPTFRQSYESAVQITVYDLDKGRAIRYSLATDLDWGSTEVAIPLDGWEARFPLAMSGLESCSAARGSPGPMSTPPPPPSDRR